jgi:hypothetical protein
MGLYGIACLLKHLLADIQHGRIMINNDHPISMFTHMSYQAAYNRCWRSILSYAHTERNRAFLSCLVAVLLLVCKNAG